MSAPEQPQRPATTPMLRFVRLWLPLIIITAGLAVGIIGGTQTAWEGAGLIISAGAAVWLLNFFFRVGAHGDHDRDRDEAARTEFERTGRWPDEPNA